MTRIDVRGASIGYGTHILQEHLDFTLTGPAFVALIGHNGAGKSTFLRTLTGQLPCSGSILINEKTLTTQKKTVRSGQLSLLEQHNSLTFDIPVKELVMMGRFRLVDFFGSYGEEDAQAVEDALGFLGIQALRDKNFQELSGGEQQLVWLAQMMVQDTDILLLDEPTQSLDMANKQRIFQWMQRVVAQKNKLVICATHDIHHLYDMEGYLLNFSHPNVTPEKLSKTTLNQHLELLYQPKEKTATHS